MIGAVLVPAAGRRSWSPSDMVRGDEAGRGDRRRRHRPGRLHRDSRETTHNDPVYVEHGVIHYAVGNMPGAVPAHVDLRPHQRHPALPRRAGRARRHRGRAGRDPALALGVNTEGGQVVNAAVAEALAHLPGRHARATGVSLMPDAAAELDDTDKAIIRAAPARRAHALLQARPRGGAVPGGGPPAGAAPHRQRRHAGGGRHRPRDAGLRACRPWSASRSTATSARWRRKLGKVDEVEYVVITAGRFDLLVEVVCADNEQLLDARQRPDPALVRASRSHRGLHLPQPREADLQLGHGLATSWCTGWPRRPLPRSRGRRVERSWQPTRGHLALSPAAAAGRAYESNPMPKRSSRRSHGPRRPSWVSARAMARRVVCTAAQRSGSGGNGNGGLRTAASRVRSVSAPASRSSADPGAEPARPHAQAGVADRPRHLARVTGAGGEHEPRRRGDRPAPAVGEADAFELGEGRQEVLGQGPRRALVLFELGADPVAVVVEGVPSAPEDPTVGRGPEVVELVAAVGQALAVPPSPSAAHCSSGSGSVTSTWSYTGTTARRIGATRPGNALVASSTGGPGGAGAGRAAPPSSPVGRDRRVTGVCSCTRAPGPLHRGQQPPRQPGRVDQPDVAALSTRRRGRWARPTCGPHRVGVEQLDLLAELAGAGRRTRGARRPATGRRRRRARPRARKAASMPSAAQVGEQARRSSRCRAGSSVASSSGKWVRPLAAPCVIEADEEAAVAPRGADAAVAGVEHEDVAVRGRRRGRAGPPTGRCSRRRRSRGRPRPRRSGAGSGVGCGRAGRARTPPARRRRAPGGRRRGRRRARSPGSWAVARAHGVEGVGQRVDAQVEVVVLDHQRRAEGQGRRRRWAGR